MSKCRLDESVLVNSISIAQTSRGKHEVTQLSAGQLNTYFSMRQSGSKSDVRVVEEQMRSLMLDIALCGSGERYIIQK